MTVDKFTYGQLVRLIALFAVIIITFGFCLNSCLDDRTVAVRHCDGDNPCAVTTVKFHNIREVPGDTLNSMAERIIESIAGCKVNR